MHVLVATDGVLDPEEVATFAEPLAKDDGKVTVLVVVEVPRSFLEDVRAAYGADSPLDETFGLRQEVGAPVPTTDQPKSWPGDEAVIDRYLSDRLDRGATPIVDYLTERGIKAEGVVIEHEKPGDAIVEQVIAQDADVLIIGSYGQDAIHGVMGSIGTKVVRRSPKPVLLIRRAALKAVE